MDTPVKEGDSKLIPANKIYQTYRQNRDIVLHTQLQKSKYLSQRYNANIWLKRLMSPKARSASRNVASSTASNSLSSKHPTPSSKCSSDYHSHYQVRWCGSRT